MDREQPAPAFKCRLVAARAESQLGLERVFWEERMPRVSTTRLPNEKRKAPSAAGTCAGEDNIDIAPRTKVIPNRSWLQNSHVERVRFSQGQARTARPRARDNPPSTTMRAPEMKTTTGKKPGILSSVHAEEGRGEVRPRMSSRLIGPKLFPSSISSVARRAVESLS